jgi:hypothetical protein
LLFLIEADGIDYEINSLSQFVDEFDEYEDGGESKIISKYLSCDSNEVYVTDECSPIQSLISEADHDSIISNISYSIGDDNEVIVDDTGACDLDEDDEADETECFLKLYEFDEGKVAIVTYGDGAVQSSIDLAYVSKEFIEKHTKAVS